MSRHAIFRVLLVCAVLTVATVSGRMVHGQESRPERHPLLPDHLKCQYAGNMGFLSLGLGYSLFGGRLQSDLFYGYVPKRRCGDDIHQLTLKNTVYFRSLRLTDTVRWTPVTAGAHLSCKVGNNNRETWVVLPKRYPDRYYPPTAMQLLLTLGTCVESLIPGSSRRAGIFFEAGTTALYLQNWLREKHVAFEEIINLSMGIVRRF